MTSALVYKELRETIGIALAGLAILLCVAMAHMGWDPLFGLLSTARSNIPFVSDAFAAYFGLVAAALAMALGLRQSIGDFWGDAHLFLLTRPVNRTTIYLTKLVVGLALYLLCAALPILLYGWWAALPGTHASPFFWSMTIPSWICWLAMTALYLGALLSGLRPAAWFGTRLAPLGAAILAAGLAIGIGGWIGLMIIALADVILVTSILFVVDDRDFA
jgi:hypothetical protein